MKTSFVVSAYNRPQHLAVLLASLAVQTERDFEVLVMDNASMQAQKELTFRRGGRFEYLPCGFADCYDSANAGAECAVGEYLCFPSDDGYYVPKFLELMLAQAPADLILCDCVYDGHGWRYAHMATNPSRCNIDKGGFLVRREVFLASKRFRGNHGRPSEADGILIDELRESGVKIAKAPGILWTHN